MKRTTGSQSARFGVPITVLAGVAALAGPADSAFATFPGEPGPIAFQRLASFEKELSAEIFQVDAGGGAVEQLTSLPGGSFAPDFSPDGSRLVFEQQASKKAARAIYTMNADGSQPVRLTFDCVAPKCLGDDAAAWTAAGEILFQRGLSPVKRGEFPRAIDLMIMKADGSSPRVLRRFLPNRDDRQPDQAQASPDGRSIAVTLVNTTAKPKLGSSIFLLDADGGNLRQITPPRLNAGNPDWSPDGKRIVFNSSFEVQGPANIYSVRPNGTKLRLLHRSRRNQAAFDPVWSPDGRRIACVRYTGGRFTQIWAMKPNGTGLRKLTHGRGFALRPDWGARP
jgi:Tol biopolymer transport system component